MIEAIENDYRLFYAKARTTKDQILLTAIVDLEETLASITLLYLPNDWILN
jgi:hypothetical protein